MLQTHQSSPLGGIPTSQNARRPLPPTPTKPIPIEGASTSTSTPSHLKKNRPFVGSKADFQKVSKQKITQNFLKARDFFQHFENKPIYDISQTYPKLMPFQYIVTSAKNLLAAMLVAKQDHASDKDRVLYRQNFNNLNDALKKILNDALKKCQDDNDSGEAKQYYKIVKHAFAILNFIKIEW
tara:strand:+ start:1176 stop:1721 length:546 start_codon:yes stop_codon:yes gene_type:complete